MSSNRFIGSNIFFRFIKANQNGFYKSKTITTVIPISNLDHIDYEHETNITRFYFKNCKFEIIPEERDFDIIKSIKTQISNGNNFIDIKE